MTHDKKVQSEEETMKEADKTEDTESARDMEGSDKERVQVGKSDKDSPADAL
ncbi:MAG: hypothetical protein Q8R25_03405 [bacterium]|nr:hypothetical protein [bacterium]